MKTKLHSNLSQFNAFLKFTFFHQSKRKQNPQILSFSVVLAQMNIQYCKSNNFTK